MGVIKDKFLLTQRELIRKTSVKTGIDEEATKEIILEAIKEFTQTTKYIEYYNAKTNLETDHSAASEQLKNSIRNMKKQVNTIILQTQLGS